MHTPMALVRHFAAIGHAVLWMLRHHDLRTFCRLMLDHVEARWRAILALPHYRRLSKAELLARKTSRRVFLFGSGYSLNSIPDAEWQSFQQDDSIGFSGSIYLRKLPLTYLLLRAWTETSAGSLAWKQDAADVLGAIEDNPYLNDTAFVLPKGFTSIFTNRLTGHRLWNPRHPIYYFLSDKVSRLPHRDLDGGLVHGLSTLCSAISLAVALGYDDIVLVGIDLYDSRYFWLPEDKTMGWSETEQKLVPSSHTVRGAEVTAVHNTVNNGIVRFVADWHRHLADSHGVRFSVYNPKSLLAGAIPVFSWE